MTPETVRGRLATCSYRAFRPEMGHRRRGEDPNQFERRLARALRRKVPGSLERLGRSALGPERDAGPGRARVGRDPGDISSVVVRQSSGAHPCANSPAYGTT